MINLMPVSTRILEFINNMSVCVGVCVRETHICVFPYVYIYLRSSMIQEVRPNYDSHHVRDFRMKSMGKPVI